MNRVPYVAVVCLAALSAVGCMKEPPNVVLIVMDTLRADAMGCYGSGRNTSPELDAIAAKGVRFETAISQASWTRPSMGAALTGLYPRTLGLYVEEDEALAERFVTLAEVLKENGYTTFGVNANPNLNSVFNFDQGFDKYVDSLVVFPWMKPDHDEHDRSKTKLLSAREVFKIAKDILDGAPEQPAFLMLNIMEAHEYEHERNSLNRPEFKRLFLRTPTPAYFQAARQLSFDVAEFINELIARPGWENTLFVLMSDHGEGLKDHPHVSPFTRHGKLLYESQVVVPLILYNPTWRPKTPVVERPVRIMDLMPTILDYVGIDAPIGIDGRSLMPLVRGTASEAGLPEYFTLETHFQNMDKMAVYTDEWEYVEARTPHQGTKPVELQRRGGGENGALTDQSDTHPKIVQALRAYLAQWELKHPKAKPTPLGKQMTEEEINQLKAIGYLN